MCLRSEKPLFSDCCCWEDGDFHPACHGWLPTRLVLEQKKERDGISDVEVVSAHEGRNVVVAFEESEAVNIGREIGYDRT